MRKFVALAIGVASVALTLTSPAVAGFFDREDPDHVRFEDRIIVRMIARRRGIDPDSLRYDNSPRYGWGTRRLYVGSSDSTGPYYGNSDMSPQLPPAPSNTVNLHLIVPPDAKVWIFDQPTMQTGSDRYFESPPMTPGNNYSYDIKVQWKDASGKEVKLMRHVTVWANARIDVNFTQSGQ